MKDEEPSNKEATSNNNDDRNNNRKSDQPCRSQKRERAEVPRVIPRKGRNYTSLALDRTVIVALARFKTRPRNADPFCTILDNVAAVHDKLESIVQNEKHKSKFFARMSKGRNVRCKKDQQDFPHGQSWLSMTNDDANDQSRTEMTNRPCFVHASRTFLWISRRQKRRCCCCSAVVAFVLLGCCCIGNQDTIPTTNKRARTLTDTHSSHNPSFQLPTP